MATGTQIGMTRRELEYEVQWRMRRAPREPAKMPEFLNELFVHLIDMNNQAIAAALSERERTDLPEKG